MHEEATKHAKARNQLKRGSDGGENRSKTPEIRRQKSDAEWTIPDTRYSAALQKWRPQQLSGLLDVARKMSKMLRLESAAAQLLSAPKIVRNDARTAPGRPLAGGKCSSCDLCYASRA